MQCLQCVSGGCLACTPLRWISLLQEFRSDSRLINSEFIQDESI